MILLIFLYEAKFVAILLLHILVLSRRLKIKFFPIHLGDPALEFPKLFLQLLELDLQIGDFVFPRLWRGQAFSKLVLFLNAWKINEHFPLSFS